MTITPTRIFLDTNVYIIGVVDPESCEGQILKWLGFEEKGNSSVEVVVSEELIEQVARVAKRSRNKDWGGELLGRIWQNLNVCYVQFDLKELTIIEATGTIPREDTGVYLTAREGKAQCFVSANYKLIRTLAREMGEFECLTPEEFVNSYLLG